MPAADAFKTHIRRSSLRACPIIHLSAVDVESASVALVTSQSIHQSQDMSRSGTASIEPQYLTDSGIE
ncbi:UNVERIFIED_ORG: hypothetical protein GGE64_006047 [Rhizobium etli]